MATASAAATDGIVLDPKRDRLVIIASSLGTVFEWYDFFVYGTLAALLGNYFFPSDNEGAALLKSLAAFGVGFGVRPLGAIVFGHFGDLVGRKYTFLATITLMGVATALVGVLPTYAEIGIWAPILLLVLRIMQGLALGGEYGGAAIYVAEHAPPGKRGFYTSFIQASVVGGFLLSIAVVLGVTAIVGKEDFVAWGWRIPFLFSLLLLAISLYIRLKLKESPIFAAMKSAGTTSKNPVMDSIREPGNLRPILIAMIGVAAGLTVIWYTAQFQTLYFLQQAARVDQTSAQILLGIAACISAPLFVLAGWLSDKVGRKPLMVVGYGLTLIFLFPLFHLIADAANPALAKASERAPVTVANASCSYNPFASGKQESECAQVLDFFTKKGVGYTKLPGEGRTTVAVGGTLVEGLNPEALQEALRDAGYPGSVDPATGKWDLRADPEARDDLMILFGCVMLGLLSAMTYGPVAAILVEMFPARIRYTSLSVPYHIGTGYFGGFLPFVAQYIVVTTGDVFGGLWYTFAVVAVALVVTVFFLPETRHRDITK
ncbi:MFS transporter [Glacieibacterium frigidum]|uniref:MHS family MFS transporter n=1 Tax=Glacieibacterium frigidum TaxID=2593303 RepID=A0A552U7I5_9SPHN|nr:MFS transporter [Glacieibacterium frigidum]TRW14178.1 MHS family MFS transporter [Glacieibacterium frigidum]